MKSTTLTFGKYAGLSLPQIILRDADWFFWALRKGVFWDRLADEADDLARKAKRIKIPKPDPENWEVEYHYEDAGHFVEFEFVPADVPSYCGYRWVRSVPYLDLSCIHQYRTYDKRGCKNLLRDFRHFYFGDDVLLTKRRCERFFSRRRNFIRLPKTTVDAGNNQIFAIYFV